MKLKLPRLADLRPNKLRISHRLMLFIPVLMLAVGTCLVFGLDAYKRSLLDDRMEMTKELVQVGVSIAKHWHAKEQAGELKREQAINGAKEELRRIRFGEDNYFFINGYDGITVLNPNNAKLEGKQRMDARDPTGIPHVRMQVEAAKAGGNWVHYHFAKVGGDKPVPKISYTLGFEPWGWAVGTGIYIDDVDAIYERFLSIACGITLLVMLIGGATAAALACSISKPLTQITDRMGALTDGNLEVEVPFLGEPNELGRLAHALDAFKQSRREAEQLAQARDAEQMAKQQRQETLEQAVSDFNRQAAHIIEGVARAAESVQSHARSLAEMAEHSRSSIETVGRAAVDTTGNVQAVAGAAEELSTAVDEVNQRVNTSADVARRAVAETQRTDATMRGLVGAAQHIGKVVQMIQGIAAQTNLLALNATIEAARAGEHGKGFAVVAGEVKTLADQTTRATQDIQEQVGAIQNETGRAVEAIKTIGSIVQEMDEIAAAIAAAMEQQGATSRDIARNITQAATRTGEMSANVVSVGQAAETTSSSASELHRASDQLRQQAAELDAEMKSFMQRMRAA